MVRLGNGWPHIGRCDGWPQPPRALEVRNVPERLKLRRPIICLLPKAVQIAFKTVHNLEGSAKGAAWLHRKEDAFPTLTMRDEIAVVRHIDEGILTGAIGTCLISI